MISCITSWELSEEADIYRTEADSYRLAVQKCLLRTPQPFEGSRNGVVSEWRKAKDDRILQNFIWIGTCFEHLLTWASEPQ